MSELDDELYRIVRGMAARAIHSGGDVTMDPTELLHEAWMKVIGSGIGTENRPLFVSVSSKAIRSVLVDRARRRGALKRGGPEQHRTTLTGIADMGSDLVGVMELEAVLEELEAESPRMAQVVQMRVYGGHTISECAEALGVSTGTVNADWRFARALLKKRLQG